MTVERRTREQMKDGSPSRKSMTDDLEGCREAGQQVAELVSGGCYDSGMG